MVIVVVSRPTRHKEMAATLGSHFILAREKHELSDLLVYVSTPEPGTSLIQMYWLLIGYIRRFSYAQTPAQPPRVMLHLR